MIDQRRADLARHLKDLRDLDGWHLFQNFTLGLLHHDGYRDIRHSNVRSDFGRDAVAVSPDGERCFVAVSFECTKAKVLADARRWTEDPHREPATVMMFLTSDTPVETAWSAWKADVEAFGLELRLFNRETILEIATRDDVWGETCARLGLSGDRPGYRLISPYDGDLVRSALRARPPEWLARRIELREWKHLSSIDRNRLILGKPGSGKTTTLFRQLERSQPKKVIVVEPDLRESKVEGLLDHAVGGVVVFDDAHERPAVLQALFSALRARQRDVPEVSERYNDVRLLLAARSQEWTHASRHLPLTELGDLGLLGTSQITLSALSRAQCRELIEACRDEWSLLVEDRLLDHAAVAAVERDATPLYVLSMLAPSRARSDRKLRDADLAGLPTNLLELWARYWLRLSAAEQGVLRVVKLFTVTAAPAKPELFASAMDAFSLTPHDVSNGFEALEANLWVSRTGTLPSCLDVQLAAIQTSSSDFARWDSFVAKVSTDSMTKAELRLATGEYYVNESVPMTKTRDERHRVLSVARSHFADAHNLAGESRPAARARTLNNMSVCDGELAELETTQQGRRVWLAKAIAAVEEAISLYRKLDLQGELATALNNVSSFYSELARLEATREGKRSLFEKATGGIKEAVSIYRKLDAKRNLAMALNNLSMLFFEVARLETTREDRQSWLEKGVEVVEQAVAIRRQLGIQGALASALNTVSILYAELGRLRVAPEARRSWLQKAATAVEEGVDIYRKVGAQSKLAMALSSLSTHGAGLAELETAREDRRLGLRKAIDAIEEAIKILRKLGIQGDLATALGASCLRYRERAKESEDRAARLADLRASRDAIDEAARIFREVGDSSYFLMSLQDVVMAHILLAHAGDPMDEKLFLSICDEGKRLAESMENKDAATFFDEAKKRRR